MSVCSPKTGIVLIGKRGWHKEAEYGSHVVENDAKCGSWRTNFISWSRLFGMHSTWMYRTKTLSMNKEKHVRTSTFCYRNWKISRMGETSRKNCRVVPRHGKDMRKVRWEVWRTGEQTDGTILHRFNALLGRLSFQERGRNLNQLENYQKSAHRLSWNACTWLELVDLTFYGQWPNLLALSPNGHELVTNV